MVKFEKNVKSEPKMGKCKPKQTRHGPALKKTAKIVTDQPEREKHYPEVEKEDFFSSEMGKREPETDKDDP